LGESSRSTFSSQRRIVTAIELTSPSIEKNRFAHVIAGRDEAL